MKSNQALIVAFVSVTFIALLGVVGQVSAFAIGPQYDGHEISSGAYNGKAVHSPATQLVASARATQVHQGSGVVNTGSGGTGTASGGTSPTIVPSGVKGLKKVFGNSHCWNQCLSQCPGCEQKCTGACGCARPIFK